MFAISLSTVFAGMGDTGSIDAAADPSNAEPAAAESNLTQTISGTVVDAITGFPLIGANIILVDSDPLVGTITDVNGNFLLPGVPLGRQPRRPGPDGGQLRRCKHPE